MGFFNDLKEDLASAVNELTDEKAKENTGNYLNEKYEYDSDNSFKKNKKEKKSNENLEREIQNILNGIDENKPIEEVIVNEEEIVLEEGSQIEEEIVESAEETTDENDTDIEVQDSDENAEEASLDKTSESVDKEPAGGFEGKNMTFNNNDTDFSSDNYTLINVNTTISGSITSEGSIEIAGNVEGDVTSGGEIIITGTVTGNVEGLVVSLNSGRIRGNVKSYNGLIISEDSVLIGDIESNEADIAGAIKGKIDVNGPVILQAGAKVLGDIDCKSVQILNGAVIEGKCSQKYADVSPSAFFENL